MRAKSVEQRLAGMKPDAGVVFPAAGEQSTSRAPRADRLSSANSKGSSAPGRPGSSANRSSRSPRISTIKQARPTFHQPAHVGGKELQVALSLHLRSQVLAGHLLFRHAVDLGVALADLLFTLEAPSASSIRSTASRSPSAVTALAMNLVSDSPSNRRPMTSNTLSEASSVANLFELLKEHLQHPVPHACCPLPGSRFGPRTAGRSDGSGPSAVPSGPGSTECRSSPSSGRTAG